MTMEIPGVSLNMGHGGASTGRLEEVVPMTVFGGPWRLVVVVLALAGCDTTLAADLDGPVPERASPTDDLGGPSDGPAGESSDAPACSLGQCYLGVAFADCPGSAAPELHCNETACRWFAGCVPAGAGPAFGTDCACQGTGCPQGNVARLFVTGRGTDPWTRERDLVVTVAEVQGVGSSTPVLTCTGCGGSCALGDNPCSTGPAVLRESPGTEVVVFHTNGGLWGWWLELELDLERTPPMARICRIPFSDMIACDPGQLVCASQGKISLAPGQGPLSGELSAQFPDGASFTGTF